MTGEALTEAASLPSAPIEFGLLEAPICPQGRFYNL